MSGRGGDLRRPSTSDNPRSAGTPRTYDEEQDERRDGEAAACVLTFDSDGHVVELLETGQDGRVLVDIPPEGGVASLDSTNVPTQDGIIESRTISSVTTVPDGAEVHFSIPGTPPPGPVSNPPMGRLR